MWQLDDKSSTKCTGAIIWSCFTQAGVNHHRIITDAKWISDLALCYHPIPVLERNLFKKPVKTTAARQHLPSHAEYQHSSMVFIFISAQYLCSTPNTVVWMVWRDNSLVVRCTYHLWNHSVRKLASKLIHKDQPSQEITLQEFSLWNVFKDPSVQDMNPTHTTSPHKWAWITKSHFCFALKSLLLHTNIT